MRYYIAVFAIVLCLGMSIEGGKDESKFARLAVQASNSTRQASELDNLDSLFGTFQDFLKKLESRFASVESKLSTAVSTLQSKLSSQQNSLSSHQSRLATALNDMRVMKSKLADLETRTRPQGRDEVHPFLARIYKAASCDADTQGTFDKRKR